MGKVYRADRKSVQRIKARDIVPGDIVEVAGEWRGLGAGACCLGRWQPRGLSRAPSRELPFTLFLPRLLGGHLRALRPWHPLPGQASAGTASPVPEARADPLHPSSQPRL